MYADISTLVVGLLIFISSLISLKLGLSVAIIEIISGVLAGNLGLKTEEWMIFLSGFGGIVLTFLAGAEIDTRLMKKKFRESFLIGLFSFLIPFIGGYLYAYYLAGWSLQASLITGIALSETSLAVVYSALVENNLSRTEVGKMLMAATFITNTGTALVLSILFARPSLYTFIFIAVSILVIIAATKFSHYVFDNPKLKNRVIARKSIVAYKDIIQGEVFSCENLTVKRPGTGINPMKWDSILGKTARRDFKKDEVIEI